MNVRLPRGTASFSTTLRVPGSLLHLLVLTAPLVVGIGLLGLVADPVSAAGGMVKLKTDNGPDGFRYVAGGSAAARYVTQYHPEDFATVSRLCGVRKRDLDPVGAPFETLPIDLRREDPNCPGYADLTSAGLIADADPSSVQPCSTLATPTTATFGGGTGIPYPGGRVYVTASKPALVNQADDQDQCFFLLDTSGTVVNRDSRVQGLAPGGIKEVTPNAFNHFLELIAFEPNPILSLRVAGSSRFPGDPGLPVMFARRACDPSGSDCKSAPDGGTTDDFITATFVIDNEIGRGPGTVALDVRIDADRSVLNPKLGFKEVSRRFRALGGGPRLPGPFVIPQGTRTIIRTEVGFAIPSGFLGSFPVNLPFRARLTDANDPGMTIHESSAVLGIRPHPGYYDDDLLTAGYLISQTPVCTGDSLMVRFDGIDLPSTVKTVSIRGAEMVGGEFGGTSHPGIDAYELRSADPILPNAPDLSPRGLLRQVATVGDPGNADGLVFGPPATTMTVGHTDFVYFPASGVGSITLFALAVLNPGDTLTTTTAIGASSTAPVLVGHSSVVAKGSGPVFPIEDHDLAIRLQLEASASLETSRRTPSTKEGSLELPRAANTWTPLKVRRD